MQKMVLMTTTLMKALVGSKVKYVMISMEWTMKWW